MIENRVGKRDIEREYGVRKCIKVECQRRVRIGITIGPRKWKDKVE